MVTLGEGLTPLLRVPAVERGLGLRRVYIKDEGRNPTGTFKARGMSVAVSMARSLGLKWLAVPSAGNAGAALAAYAARAGLAAVVVAPRDAPPATLRTAVDCGASVFLVEGLISDAGRIVKDLCAPGDFFDVSTMAEPYRVEGKKTMALEIAEQLPELPDWILFPTGGGTGIVGMWKAFQELEGAGLLGGPKSRLVAVQAAGCAPIVRAFHQGRTHAEPWRDAATAAAGLRVPSPLADELILAALRGSGGNAIAVRDGDMVAAAKEMARTLGILPALEGAAAFAGLKELVAQEQIEKDEAVVVFNTGSASGNPSDAPPSLPVVREAEHVRSRLGRGP